MSEQLILQLKKQNLLHNLVSEAFELAQRNYESKRIVNELEIQSSDKLLKLNIEKSNIRNCAKSIDITVLLEPIEKCISNLLNKIMLPNYEFSVCYNSHLSGIFYDGKISFQNPVRINSYWHEACEETQEFLKILLKGIGINISEAKAIRDQLNATHLEIKSPKDIYKKEVILALLDYKGPIDWQIIAKNNSLFGKNEIFVRNNKNEIFAKKFYHSTTIFGFVRRTYSEIERDLEKLGFGVRETSWELVCKKDSGEWWKNSLAPF